MNSIHNDERAETQARAQLASIEDLVKCLEHAEECNDRGCGADCPHEPDEAREGILNDPLCLEVRGAWHTPAAFDACAPYEYKILLCWGGPAVQIIGTLDAYNQPDSARLQYQDWFTEWTDYPLTHGAEETLIKYAREFSFDL